MSTPVTSATWFDDSTKTGQYVLTQDITIDDNVYVELSGASAEFDGQDHTITIVGGLSGFLGLFRLTDGATVKNVVVQVASTEGVTDSMLEYGAGWLVQEFSSGSVLSCSSDGDANNGSSGGLVGRYFRGTISRCECTGNVIAGGAGGIVGSYLASDNVGDGYDTTISDCVMRGSILGPPEGYSCGGIAGCNAGDADGVFNVRVQRCAMLGATISDITSQTADHGGIVGPYAFGYDAYPDISASFVLTDCYNVATVGFRSAGIVASEPAYNAYGGTFTVSNCYNAGDVVGADSAGIVGQYPYGTSIKRCFNLGDIGVPSSGSPGDETYSAFPDYPWGSAGITVYPYYSDADDLNTTITDCYNAGDILAEGCGGIVSIDEVDYYVDISNCYSSGAVSMGSGGLSNYWIDDGTASYSSVFVTGGKLFFTKDASDNWLPATVDPSANVLNIRSKVPSGWNPTVWSAVPGSYPVLRAFTQSPWSRYSVYTDAPILANVTVKRNLYPVMHAVTQTYESVRLVNRLGRLFAVFEQSRKPGLQGVRAPEVSLRSSARPMERRVLQPGDLRQMASLKLWAAMRGKM